ncbi:MAG: hypothetical protein ACHWZW_05230 [Spirulina sp.]
MFYRYLTGWISLCILVTGFAGVAQAEEAGLEVEQAEDIEIVVPWMPTADPLPDAALAFGSDDEVSSLAVEPLADEPLADEPLVDEPAALEPEPSVGLAAETLVSTPAATDSTTAAPSHTAEMAEGEGALATGENGVRSSVVTLARAEAIDGGPASAVAPRDSWPQAEEMAVPTLAQAIPQTTATGNPGNAVNWNQGSPESGYASLVPGLPAGYPAGALVAFPVGAFPVGGSPLPNPSSPAASGYPSGTVVPWAMAQGAGGVVPGMPAVPGMPTAMSGYPGAPMGGGMWMMVWVPSGASLPGYPMPGAALGMPLPGTPAYGMPMPYGAPMGAVPNGGAWPNGMVGYAPISPYGTLPGAGMGTPMAYPYGGPAPGGNGYGAVGTPVPTLGVQPYAQIEPPPTSTPLAVPALPRVPGSGAPTQLLPPSTSVPASPGVGFPSANGMPFPGAGSLPPTTAQFPQPTAPLPGAPSPTVSTNGMAVAPALEDPNQAVTATSLNLEGLYVLQAGQSSARARLSGSTFLTPNLLVGGALDLVTGPDLTNSDGVQLTELYVAAAVPGVPGLRFRLGQLDITSYFDRNSFAKDVGRDFFNSTFHTNPALIAGANATASRPGGLVQWSLNDDLTLSASAFSSAANITDFALDGFAGEVSLRTGDLILRGTFLTGRDTDFQGTGDRLDAYGVNAEWFLPQTNLGFFGRYGQLNSSGGFSGSTYSLGMNAFDVFMNEDRLGLAYGRNLPSASVNGLTPDVLEVFYDFEALPNVRMGFTFQQRNQLRESFAGFRIRSGIDLLPNPSLQ